MKKNLQSLMALGAFLLFLGTGSAWGATILQETMGSPSSNTNVNSHTGWATPSSTGITFSGDGTCDVRTTSASSGYTDASGSGNVMINNITKWFKISGINTENYTGLELSFGLRKGATDNDGTNFIVEYSTNGSDFTPLNFAALPTGSGTSKWYLVTISSGIPSSATLYLRFRSNIAVEYRLDDVKLTGVPPCTDPDLQFTGITGGKKTVKTGSANFTETATSITGSGGVITYSSDKPAVATVSPTTGEVTVVGTGITTITADQAAAAPYCVGTAAYKLVVGEEFQLVTKDNQLIAGGEYIVVSKADNDEYYGLGKQNSTNRVPVLIDAPTSSSIFAPIASATTDDCVFKLKLGGLAGAWTLTDVVNNYTLGSATGTGSDNHLKQNDLASWTIAIADETSQASMTCTGNGHSTRNILQLNYNSGNPFFACYTGGQDPVYLYATPETLASTGIGTIAIATAADAVVATKYYNLQGAEVVTPQSGNIYIAKQIHASGKVSVAKIMKN